MLPLSPEAVELIHALSEELAHRYDYMIDGAGNFKPEDSLVARSAFVIGRTRGRAVACGAFNPLEDKVAEINQSKDDFWLSLLERKSSFWRSEIV